MAILAAFSLPRCLARIVSTLVLRISDRKQNGCTLFLRNRAELELIRRLTLKIEQNSRIDIAVFACSKGAEVYSIAWTLKSARPDLTVNIQAVDILPDVVKVAEQGCYSLRDCDEWGAPFGRIYEDEMKEMFDRNGDVLSVKHWSRLLGGLLYATSPRVD